MASHFLNMNDKGIGKEKEPFIKNAEAEILFIGLSNGCCNPFFNYTLFIRKLL